MVDIFKAWMGNKIENPKVLSQETIASLTSDSPGNEFCHRILDSASLVLKVCRSLDHRLQGNYDVDNFFKSLAAIEQAGLNPRSFEGKTVIIVEGLEGNGKTTIANKISESSKGVVISANTIEPLNRVRHIFQSLPSPVEKAFEYVINYFIAYEIAKNAKDHLFIVDQFHHAVCVRGICEKVPTAEEVQSVNKTAFEWPFDLPLPELVLFLSVPTDTRLQRLERDGRGVNSSKVSSAAAKDNKENLVYSMICGPTTVGIDGSGSAEDSLNIIYDAFDYYGVNITRNAEHHQQQEIVDKHLSVSSTTSSVDSVGHVMVGGAGDDTSGQQTHYPKENRRISMGVYGVFTKM